MTHDVLQTMMSSMNPEQQDAVRYVDGPSLVLAGAGSGKTRVLVHKAVYLMAHEEVDPESILMITFTNKAAGEMKKRIQEMMSELGGARTKRKSIGFIGTFHSWCARTLRTYGHLIGVDPRFIIFTDDDQKDVIKKILKTLDIAKPGPSSFLHKISDAKNQLIGPLDYLKHFSFYKAATYAEVYMAYEESLRAQHALDFDDLLFKTVHLLRSHPDVCLRMAQQFAYILIDEFQDTNGAQYEMVRLLGMQTRNITAVGDFSQAIYSWRGADIRNLERLSKDFPEAKVFSLERNYRSTQSILDYAYQKIIENQSHPILKLYTQAHTGEAVYEHEAHDEDGEADYVVSTIRNDVAERAKDLDVSKSMRELYDDYAVLYRTNAQSRAIEEMCLKQGVPYVLYGGTRFYDRKEVKDLIAYVRLIVNPLDIVALDRIKKLGKRRYGAFQEAFPELSARAVEESPHILLSAVMEKTKYLDFFDAHDPEDASRIENIRELQSVASTQTDITAFFERIALVENEYGQQEGKNGEKIGIRLMSLHAAKGLEFDTVFIVGLEEGILPHVRSLEDMHALEEERRLFYVGITRAKRKLFITHARHRGMWGRRSYGAVSRFIRKESNSDRYSFDPYDGQTVQGTSRDVHALESPAFESNSSADDWNW